MSASADWRRRRDIVHRRVKAGGDANLDSQPSDKPQGPAPRPVHDRVLLIVAITTLRRCHSWQRATFDFGCWAIAQGDLRMPHVQCSLGSAIERPCPHTKGENDRRIGRNGSKPKDTFTLTGRSGIHNMFVRSSSRLLKWLGIHSCLLSISRRSPANISEALADL